jgi:hypothetical protein
VRIGPRQAFGSELWCKKLSDKRLALILLNRSGQSADITVQFSELPIVQSAWELTDLWTQKLLGAPRCLLLSMTVSVNAIHRFSDTIRCELLH